MAALKKKTIDSAVFAAAGGLLLWGAYEQSRAESPESKTNSALGFTVTRSPGSLASVAGIALGTYGAYRLSPKAGVALLVSFFAVGEWNKLRAEDGKTAIPWPSIAFNSSPGDGLDTGLDPSARKAVHAALVMETDPTMLYEFAHKLHAAGHVAAARLIGSKAAQVAAAQGGG